MTKTSGASTDTRPLDPEELSNYQIQAIAAIEERLREPNKTQVHTKRNDDGKYLAFVEVRYPRVLLLDGDRGTGKTSFMLTLAERWNPPEEKKKAEHQQRQDRIMELGNELGPNLSAPDHVRVLDIMDFDPLPPGMPLIAALVQALRPIVEAYDRIRTGTMDPEGDGFDDLLIDDWHRLFAMAAGGWSSGSGRSLLDQVLDRETQVHDWHELDWHWRELIDKVIDCGASLNVKEHKLTKDPVLVIMIDDCDLQVDRVRELLPALRLLYHPRVFFIVAADRPHMIDMLQLDFLGQQNRLARDRDGPPFGDIDRRNWAQTLAEAAFEKVFPIRNRFELRKLALAELLSFESGDETFASILAHLKQSKPQPSRFHDLADYLTKMAGPAEDPVELPRTWTNRTAHQIGEFVQDQGPPCGQSALEAVGRLLGRNEYADLVRVIPAGSEAGATEPLKSESRLQFLQQGKMEAYFIPDVEEDITQSAKIMLSARPHIRYTEEVVSLDESDGHGEISDRSSKYTAAILAISMQDDGFPVEVPRISWNTRLALVWTSIKLSNHNLSLAWPRYRHPSPLRLLNWTKDWRDFLSGLRQSAGRGRPERIAYAWIYYQLKWMGSQGLGRELKVAPPLVVPLKGEDWTALLQVKPLATDEDDEWFTHTLPLLARPEIGLPKEIQERLLQRELTKDQKQRLYDQRRQLITDGIYAAEESQRRTAPDDANDSGTVAEIILDANTRQRNIYGPAEAIAWNKKIEDNAGNPSDAGTSSDRQL